jgi:hypothetical protein
MINSASTNANSPAAFSLIMPLRTPVAEFCKTRRHRHPNHLFIAHCRSARGTPPSLGVHAAAIMITASASADVQIAIAPRTS